MAIAQSTKPSPAPQPVSQSVVSQDALLHGVDVPIEIYNYFSTDPQLLSEKAKSKIQDIFNWSKDGAKDIGDIYLKLSELENKLGSPRHDERRYDKMWLWVEMTKKLNSIEKQRNSLRAV